MTPRPMTAGPSRCPPVGAWVVRCTDGWFGQVTQHLNHGECGPRELRCRWNNGHETVELRAAVALVPRTNRSAA